MSGGGQPGYNPNTMGGGGIGVASPSSPMIGGGRIAGGLLPGDTGGFIKFDGGNGKLWQAFNAFGLSSGGQGPGGPVTRFIKAVRDSMMEVNKSAMSAAPETVVGSNSASHGGADFAQLTAGISSATPISGGEHFDAGTSFSPSGGGRAGSAIEMG
jgi:hypothetical protein